MVQKAGLHMPLRKRITVRCILTLAVILMAFGSNACGPEVPSNPAGRGAMRRYVLSGFKDPPSRLFVSKGRLFKLRSHLGFNARKYSYGVNHSSDGTSLRCWNRDRSEAILITKGQPPRTITVPPWSFLDDGNKPIAWYVKDASTRRITFAGGHEMFAPGFHVDSSGQVFCYGGTWYDYETKTGRESPIKVAFVSNPQRPVATSKMKGMINGIFATDTRVYVLQRGGRDRLVCEEFTRDGKTLRKKRRFEVRPPAMEPQWTVVEDFDPKSGTFLIKVGRYIPFPGPIWYLYVINTGQFREVGIFGGSHVGFLDRNIFDRALEGLPDGPAESSPVGTMPSSP